MFMFVVFFFFKPKTAYEIRISDWSSDVCSSDLIEGTYHLEVSSPGIDRPLTRPKDFANWAGHEVKITLGKSVEGPRNLRGILKGIEGDLVTIEDRKDGPVSIALETIHAAKLVLTDALIAATRPLDSSGADELEVEQAED